MALPKSKANGSLNRSQPILPQAAERATHSGDGAISAANKFWTRRCAAYASYFEKLPKCANLFDVARLQTTFWKDLQRDYLDEGAYLAASASLTGLPNFARNATPLPLSFLGGMDRAIPIAD